METLNKSSAAERRIFCSQAAVQKMGNTYSIPSFSEPCLKAKSLAASSCRFNQSFPLDSQGTPFPPSYHTRRGDACKIIRISFTFPQNPRGASIKMRPGELLPWRMGYPPLPTQKKHPPVGPVGGLGGCDAAGAPGTGCRRGVSRGWLGRGGWSGGAA